MYKHLLKTYRRLLRDHLVLVQSAQTGMLMGTGDLLAQTLVEKKSLKDVQLVRTAQFFTIGAVLIGPALTVWYKFLSKTIGHGSNMSVVLKKVALDQLVFAPTFLAIFMCSLNFMQGHDWAHVKEQLNLKYKDILLANYMIWPAIQIVNFQFVPLRHQVLLVQSVALSWNTYLSWKTEAGNTDDQK